MYVYLNASTQDLIAIMPVSRGRAAKNHNFVEINGLELSINFIPNEAVSSISSAGAAKAYVAANGSVDVAIAPAHVMTCLLRAAKTYISDPETVSEIDELLASAIDADWESAAVRMFATVRRAVNAAMIQQERGWFYETTESTDEPTEEDADAIPVSYGFARLSGEKPQLNVVRQPAEEKRDDHGVFYPKPDSTYIINPGVEKLFKILEVSSKKCPQNVNLIGPHGCGKTELAIQFAARHNRPLLIMDCANLREARDWFGYKTARDGTVYWHESQFVRAVQSGNHVILLDELNRANPNLLNTLMPILDARRFTYLEERGDKIVVGPGTVFFASMNEGAGYTGTSSLDRAVRDRFPRAVELTYLGENDEVRLLVNRTGVNADIAKRLVQMANKIRQDSTGLSASLTESLSTRQLIAAAHDFAIGGVDTLEFTITNHFSPDGEDDSERTKVQSIIQGKFGDLFAAQAADKISNEKKGA
ncbi:AAA family ATPase [bacterium]|nr:AAA family ATPase [bacterium]